MARTSAQRASQADRSSAGRLPGAFPGPTPNSSPSPNQRSSANAAFLRSAVSAAAVLYSLTGTCERHDIDPFAYLQDILRRLPSHPADQLDDLLPDVWFASHSSARRKKAA